MKKSLLILFILISILGCQKEDKNGDLDGFWKLQEIAINDGDISNTKEKNIFWRVQLDLIQIGNSFGRFQHTGDSLFIQMIDVSGKALIDYGIYKAEDERFAVEQLGKKSMMLKSDYARLRFRKF